MAKHTGEKQTENKVTPKVNGKRKYSPPLMIRLKPYKETYGGGVEKKEKNPVFNGPFS